MIFTMKKQIEIIVHFFFVALFLLLSWSSRVDVAPNTLFISSCIFLSISQFIFWHRCHKDRLGGWLHPVPIFYLCLILPCFYIPFFYSVDLTGEIWGRSRIIYDSTVINRSVALSALGLSSFFCGYTLLFNNIYNKKSLHYGRDRKAAVFCTLTKPLITFLCIFVISMMVLFLCTSGRSILQGKYLLNEWGTGAFGRVGLPVMLMSVVVMLTLEAYRMCQIKPVGLIDFLKKYNKLVLITFFIFVLPFLLVGSRQYTMMTAPILVVSYFFTVRPLAGKLFLSIFVAGFFVFAILGMARSGQDKFDLKKGIQDFSATNKSLPEMLPFSKTAISYRTWNYGIHAKDASMLPEGHWPGRFTSQQLVRFIPFGRSGFGIDFFSDPVHSHYQSSCFFHQRFSNNTPNMGPGTLALVTPYFDFGTLGLIVFFLIIGGIYAIIEKSYITTQNPYLFLMFCLLFFQSMMFSAEKIVYFASMMYCCMLMLILHFFTILSFKFAKRIKKYRILDRIKQFTPRERNHSMKIRNYVSIKSILVFAAIVVCAVGFGFVEHQIRTKNTENEKLKEQVTVLEKKTASYERELQSMKTIVQDLKTSGQSLEQENREWRSLFEEQMKVAERVSKIRTSLQQKPPVLQGAMPGIATK